MKYFFLLILIISSILNATPTVDIKSKNIKLQEFKLEYFVDETKSMKIQEVQKQHFIQGTSSLSLGMFKNVTWFRFKLHNSTQHIQRIYVHNQNAYISNAIDFYEFQDNKLNKSLEILLKDTKDTDLKMYGSDAIFMLSLDANETKEVYIKSTMNVMQYPYFCIYDEVNSKKRVSENNSVLLIVLGMLMALALYHAFLYLHIKFKEYIYYSLYLFSAAIWESFLSGMLANGFNIYVTEISQYFLLSVLFIPIFLTLFAKSIFETKERYKEENKFLNSIIVFFLLNFLIGLYDVHSALIVASFFFSYMFVVLFLTTYSIMKKGNPLALTFLIANTIFTLFMMITNLYYQGYLNYSPFIFNAASIGIIIEALLLSLLLSYRIKILQKSEIKASRALIIQIEKSRKKDKILFAQNKMYSMGEMLENIAHQWRQPLAQVNASVLTIDNILYDNKHADTKIERELINIENLTNYMSRTIDSFRGFFDKNKEAREFSIKSIINSSVLILGKSQQSDAISIIQEIPSDFLYKGYENELQQVILVILNNAKEALTSKKTVNPQIDIKVVKINDDYKISICDNAGGIDQKIIDKIFDPYFTTKHQKQGTGIGLYMSKIIIEDNMNGQISVRNIANGVCFNIVLSKNQL